MWLCFDIIVVDFCFDYVVLIDVIKDFGFLWILVYDEDIDNVIGIFYVKDLLGYLYVDNNFEW